MKMINKYFIALMVCFSLSAFAQSDCDEQCLAGVMNQYLSDVTEQDFSALPWADQVRYTENNIAMMIGDGFWGAGPGVNSGGLILADETTGNVVWFGVTTEHGQAAYHGLRLKVVDREITEVESYVGREGTPDLFADTAGYEIPNLYSRNIRSSERRERERMIAVVDGYFNTKQLNDGVLFTEFSDGCERVTNGVNVTNDTEHWTARVAKGCQQQLELGIYKPVDRIRARRYPVVDLEKGVVVALSLEDHAARYVDYQAKNGEQLKIDIEYPTSHGMLELFKIRDGKIEHIEGVSVFLPYYIHSLWSE